MFSSLTVAFLLIAASVSAGNVPGNRIVGGLPATRSQFPYFALIEKHDGSNVHLCGGSLINSEWILTTAACIFNADRHVVYLGKVLARDVYEEGEYSVEAEYGKMHDQFDVTKLENNVGLLKLPSHVASNHYISPIDLDGVVLVENNDVVTLGYGYQATGSSFSDHLMYLTTKVISATKCTQQHPNIVNKQNIVCTNSDANHNTCVGDYGGPLVVYRDNVPYLAGVSSDSDGEKCDTAVSTVYMQTAMYSGWISETITNYKL